MSYQENIAPGQVYYWPGSKLYQTVEHFDHYNDDSEMWKMVGQPGNVNLAWYLNQGMLVLYSQHPLNLPK